MTENLKDTSEKLKYPNKSHEDSMIECYNSGEKVACKLLENRVNWLYISRYMLLSEGFIREYQGLVCWESISMHQALSKKFIREFKDKVEWYYISDKQIDCSRFYHRLYCTDPVILLLVSSNNSK